MSEKIAREYKQKLARIYPYGDKWEFRKIRQTPRVNQWYKKGDIIKVKYFATFGAYDYKDRWVDYYDLSRPLKIQWFYKLLFWLKIL